MFPFDRHERLRKNLAAYADGERSVREVAAVERHLAACDRCLGELDGLRLATAALKELPALVAPRSFALTPDMLGAPAPQPRPRAVPAYQTPLRLAAAGLAVALTVVVFADRADFRGGGQSADEAQVAGLDERASETFGATADNGGAPAGGDSISGYDSDQPENTGQANAAEAARATQAPGDATPPAAGIGVGGGGAAGSGATPVPMATSVPGDPLAAAADQRADVTPGSLPDHAAIPEDSDTKSDQDLAAAEGDADTLQDGDEREAVGNDGDSSALTIVEVVLAVLLGATLGGLGLAWFSQRRKPL